MHVNGGQHRVQAQTVDPGLLGGLPQCGTDDIAVGVLAVPAELKPSSEPRMQGQQHVLAGVVDDERRGGDVAGLAGPLATVGPGGQKCQHRVAQRILIGVRRVPVRQHRDRRLAHAHRRTSWSPVGAGSRGCGGSIG